MREILFRGKRKDSGEWIEGIPIKTHIGTFISFDENPHYCRQYGYMEIDRIAMIDEKTVCQYTGLADRNGRKIFEGDILSFSAYGEDYRGDVRFVDGNFTICCKNASPFLDDAVKKRSATVIGNIFDNPELTGGAEEHE